MTEIEYPARGFNVEAPSNAERQLTGWIATVRFTRRNHQYDVRFQGKGCTVLRDGKLVMWERLPDVARTVAHKAAKFLGGN